MFPDIGTATFRPGVAGASITQPVTPGTTLFSTLSRFSVVWGRTALFAVPSDVPLQVVVDEGAPQAMTRVTGTNYLVYLHTIELGRTNSFSVLFDGRPVAMGDVAGYLGQSYESPGVARGSMTERREVVSRVYPAAVTSYWLYVNAGTDAGRGAPVMIWHDGAGYVGGQDLAAHRLQVVSDNLVEQGLIPPMAHVLVSPSTPGEPLAVRYEGQTPEVAMRGLQYDTVSERYGRHLLDEVLPDAGKLCKLRGRRLLVWFGWPFVWRHVRFHAFVAAPWRVQPCPLWHRQLHCPPMGSRRGPRPWAPIAIFRSSSGPPQYPCVDVRREQRHRSRPPWPSRDIHGRQLATSQPADGERAEIGWL